MAKSPVTDILNLRGTKYIIDDVTMYTEESVVAALTEVLELNELLSDRCKLLQFMVDNKLSVEDMINDNYSI